MEIGVGLDGTLKLSFSAESEIAADAARLGFQSLWTPETQEYDSFQICLNRWQATRSVVSEGLVTGISVSPVALRKPMSLAMSGGTVSAITGGRFILGIGSGSIYRPDSRAGLGVPDISMLDVMRDYLISVRGLLAGNEVTHYSPMFELNKAVLGINPSPYTPVYLGALGPRMLRLSGELADGAALNWCTSEQVTWSREQIIEGAKSVGRNPDEIRIAEYIRVCIDEDIEKARKGLAKAMLGYALGPRGGNIKMGYRAHFDRMGFSGELTHIDSMRDKGATMDEMADAVPEEMLSRVGYYGPPDGAPDAITTLTTGLDIAIVRIVSARPGKDTVLNAMRACKPDLITH